MSMIVSAADDYVVRTSGLPTSTGTFTICGWAKRTTDRGAYSWLMYMPRYSATATDLGFRTNTDGDALQAFANYGTESSTVGTISDSSWFFWAVTGNGTTVTCYYQKDGGAWATPRTLTQTTFAPERLVIGDTQGATPFIGEFAQIRVWNSVLSAANLQAELLSPTPVITSNLLSNHPFNSADQATALTDTTANGYNFTANGGVTFSTSQPPQTGSSSNYPVLAGSLLLPKGQQASQLAAPANFALSASTSYSASFTWDAVVNATGYEVYASDASGGTKVLMGTTTATALTVSGLPSSATKYWTIRTLRTGSTPSAYSSEVTVTTKRVYARVYATPSAAGETSVAAIAWRAPSTASDIVGTVVGRATIASWGAQTFVAALGEYVCRADFEISQPIAGANGTPAEPLTDGEQLYYYAAKGNANTGRIATIGKVVEQ